MTIEEAIAEVRQYPNLALRPKAIQLVLTAVASCDLIPLSDHRLAVAMVVEKAVAEIDCGCGRHECGWPHACPKEDVAAILALADADALAEVQALRAELDAAREENRWAYVQAAMDDRKTDAEAEVARLREALEEIADFDTGATAGLAYTAKLALQPKAAP